MKFFPVVLCLFAAYSGTARAEPVETILSRMDQASASFHNMMAEVEMTTYTAIIDDKSVQLGTLKVQRENAADIRAVIEFKADKGAKDSKDAQVVAFQGKTVRVYYPKLNYYQDYDFGKNSSALNQFLLLGFGSSGKELSAGYEISSGGTEKLSGQDATKLVLLPKDPTVKDRLSKIEMWIPEGGANPVQQRFYEPSKNYRTVVYTNINLKPSIKGTLEFKLPKGAKKQSS